VEKIYPHPTEDLGLVLMGTIVGKADTGVAIILVKSDGRQVLRRQGERVNGAEVVDIQWDHVILNIAGNRYLLDMKETANYRIAAPSAEIDSMMQEEAGRNMEAGSSEQHESKPEEHLSPSVEPVDPLLPQRIRMEFPVESAEQQGQ
jgi:type II secretory pathway component PulC